MKPITRLELAMVLIALIVFGTGYGIWRIQSIEDHLVPGASVQKVEKKKLVERLTEKREGFDVGGCIKVSIEE